MKNSEISAEMAALALIRYTQLFSCFLAVVCC